MEGDYDPPPPPPPRTPGYATEPVYDLQTLQKQKRCLNAERFRSYSVRIAHQ